EQENARLACQRLQVFFDRPISLKEGNRGEQSARVQNLVCDENVRVEDITREGRRLVKYQRIEGTALSMTALKREDDDPRPREQARGASGGPPRGSDATGAPPPAPAPVRILQRGQVDPTAPPPGPGGTGPAGPGARPAEAAGARPAPGAAEDE